LRAPFRAPFFLRCGLSGRTPGFVIRRDPAAPWNEANAAIFAPRCKRFMALLLWRERTVGVIEITLIGFIAFNTVIGASSFVIRAR